MLKKTFFLTFLICLVISIFSQEETLLQETLLLDIAEINVNARPRLD